MRVGDLEDRDDNGEDGADSTLFFLSDNLLLLLKSTNVKSITSCFFTACPPEALPSFLYHPASRISYRSIT